MSAVELGHDRIGGDAAFGAARAEQIAFRPYRKEQRAVLDLPQVQAVRYPELDQILQGMNAGCHFLVRWRFAQGHCAAMAERSLYDRGAIWREIYRCACRHLEIIRRDFRCTQIGRLRWTRTRGWYSLM